MKRASYRLSALVPGFFLAAAFFSAPSLGAQGAPRPAYAAALEKLGFRVFDTPAPVPDFSVQGLEGGKASLASFKGKILLLNFWATWCPPCKAEMPSIQTLWDKMRNKAFAIAAISQGEDEKTVRSFITRSSYDFPVYIDPRGGSGSAYGVRGIPTTYILDKQGKAIAQAVGGRAYDAPELIALLSELAAQ